MDLCAQILTSIIESKMPRSGALTRVKLKHGKVLMQLTMLWNLPVGLSLGCVALLPVHNAYIPHRKPLQV